MAVMATFKTAYLQKESRLDAKPQTDLKVGQLCTYNSSTKTLVAKTAAGVAVGDVIIAQSDMTTSVNHVPVENRDYKYSDVVKASTSAEKLVMVFVVTDPSDVIEKVV